MENHIKKTMTQYKGRCKHWDVVNEGGFSITNTPSIWALSDACLDT